MKKTMVMLILIVIVVAFAACKKEAVKLAYPVTKKVDQVDDYFGTKVADPYRWLEDDNVRGDRGLGQGPERGHLRLPGQDPLPRDAQEAADRHLTTTPATRRPSGSANTTSSARTTGCRTSPSSTSRRAWTGRPKSSSTPTPSRPTAPIRVGLLGPSGDDKLHGRLAAARPARTGPRSGSWTSPPKRSCPTGSSGSSSPARPGGRTASSTAATTSPRPARN